MSKRIHRTVTGHPIEYEPTPKVAAFLRRIEEAVEDPNVSERELIGLAYSTDNPFLDHTLFPGRGAVTKEVLVDPAYHVLTDLLFRKRVVEQKIDVSKIEARYTMTPAEAAAELGVTESSIASWLRDGRHYLDPRAVRSLEVGTRAPTGGKRRG
jgi:hypothetical protein